MSTELFIIVFGASLLVLGIVAVCLGLALRPSPKSSKSAGDLDTKLRAIEDKIQSLKTFTVEEGNQIQEVQKKVVEVDRKLAAETEKQGTQEKEIRGVSEELQKVNEAAAEIEKKISASVTSLNEALISRQSEVQNVKTSVDGIEAKLIAEINSLREELARLPRKSEDPEPKASKVVSSSEPFLPPASERSQDVRPPEVAGPAKVTQPPPQESVAEPVVSPQPVAAITAKPTVKENAAEFAKATSSPSPQGVPGPVVSPTPTAASAGEPVTKDKIAEPAKTGLPPPQGVNVPVTPQAPVASSAGEPEKKIITAAPPTPPEDTVDDILALLQKKRKT